MLELECVLCIKKGKHSEANTFCYVCEAYLCGSCADTHGRFPALRNHKTVSAEDMKKICGLCNADGKKNEAMCFCKDCDSWICDNCKESHGNFRDLQKHIIVSKKVMFNSDSTAPTDISARFGQLSTKPSEGNSYSNTGSEAKPQNSDGNQKSYSSTQPSDDDVASSSLTKPSTDSQTVQRNISNVLITSKFQNIKEINVKVLGEIYANSISITGCCFMPGGELVLCDNNNNKIELLDHSLSVVDILDLPVKPLDVAAVDNNNVIITIPDEKQLQFIQVLPSLKIGRTIDVDKSCHGVAVAAGKIFVSCYNYDDNVGEIRVYDLEGRDLGKRLGINSDGLALFRRPKYVAVSWSGDKIFVSECSTDTVSCLTSDGKIVYQYSDDELKGPQGLFVDDSDNVSVCGLLSNTVQVITAPGEKHSTLLSREDGISDPNCVSFRPSDGTLVVGNNSD